MENETNHISLNDLRNDETIKINDVVFEKSVFGGYNKKEVNEYIKVLKESLQNAERSFKVRLEEYASMTSMLTQERDKYLSVIKQKEEEDSDLLRQIEALKGENDILKNKIAELSESVLDQNELKIFEETLTHNEEMKTKISELEATISQMEDTISELRGEIDDADKDRENSITLKNDISKMELTIFKLNEQIEEYAKNEIKKEEYEILLSENEMIRKKYDEAMSEFSIVSADKNVLAEKNKRIYEDVVKLTEKNKELREENTAMKLKTRKLISQFEARIYECGQSHKHNINQITENIKNVLNILSYESMDITKLLDCAEEVTSDNTEDLFDDEDYKEIMADEKTT